MPTILELFHSSGLKESVKADTETLVEQETSGIRVKTAVELNNPLIYGNESTRIAIRSTPSVEKMKGATGGSGGDGGLIGKGLEAISGGGLGNALFGGKVSSLSQARDGVNSKLGIPSSTIPTYVDGHGGLQLGKEPDTMITLGKIRNDAAGTEFGKFLKQTGGGNFKSIGRNILGQGISLVKDKVRDVLFGSPLSTGENSPANGSYEYSSQEPYSITIRNVKNNEVDNDKLQLPQIPSISEVFGGKINSIVLGKSPKVIGMASLDGGDELEPTVNYYSPEVPYSVYKSSPEGGGIFLEDPDLTTSKLQVPSVPSIPNLKESKISLGDSPKLAGVASLDGGDELEPTVNYYSPEVPYSVYKSSPDGGDKYAEDPDLTTSKLQVPSLTNTQDTSTSIIKNNEPKAKGNASLSNLGGNAIEGETSDVEPKVLTFSPEVPYSDYKKDPDRGNIYNEDGNAAIKGTKLDLSNVSRPSNINEDDSNTISKIGEAKPKGNASLSNLGGNPIEEETSDVEPKVLTFSPEVPYSDYKKDKERGNIYPDETKSALDTLEKNSKLGINLNTVSPIYGINRKEDERKGRLPGTNQLSHSGNSPEKPYTTGLSVMETKNGLGSSDKINQTFFSDEYTMEDDAFIKIGETTYRDFIPLWFKAIGDINPIVFRAIINGLTETSTPSWNGNKFVGNPYSFYTYGGVERSVSFNIKLFAAAPVELLGIWDKLKKLTSFTYPRISEGLTQPPIITFRLGDMYSNREVFVESLTYTIPDESNWETDGEAGYLPKSVDVAISLKFIESVGAEDRLYDMEISAAAAKALNEKNNSEVAVSEESRTSGTVSVPSKSKTKITKKKTDTTNPPKAKQVKALTQSQGNGKSIPQQSMPSETAAGIPNPITGQSAVADRMGGKSAVEASKEAETTQGITSWQADKLIQIKASRNTTDAVIVSTSKVPSWIKNHRKNPLRKMNFNSMGGHVVKADLVSGVYVKRMGNDRRYDIDNEFWSFLGIDGYGKNRQSSEFANSYDEDENY